MKEQRGNENRQSGIGNAPTGDRIAKGRVSLYATPHATQCSEVVDIWDFLLSPGSTVRDMVARIRRCRDANGRRRLKKQLPCITPAGVFDFRRGDGLRSYSGYLCIDIDGKDNAGIDAREMRHRIADAFPQRCAYAGISCGGSGVFALFRIPIPERYAEYWKAITTEIESVASLRADRACKDLCRLRFASDDPEAFVNMNCEPWDILPANRTEAAQISTNARKTNKHTSDMKNTEICRLFAKNPQLHRVEALTLDLQSRGIDIAESYADWFAIGCSLASELGEQGRPFYHSISAISAKYDPAECNAKYSECLKCCGCFTIATFYWHCKRAGLRW